MAGPRGPHAVVLHNRSGDIVAVVAVRASESKAKRYLKSKSCKQIPIQYSYSVVPVGLPEKLGHWPEPLAICNHKRLDTSGACTQCRQYIHSTN